MYNESVTRPSKIFNKAVVPIFLSPFIVECRLMEVFYRVTSTVKGLKKMVNTEKILQTMNS